MYYKIENQDCEVYKKLRNLREKEIKIEKDNKKSIEENIPYKWETFYGNSGQQNLGRVTSFSGFCFSDPDIVDTKVWKALPDGKGCFIPNKRTKAGREMAEFLLNGLSRSNFYSLWEILELPELGRFAFPYLEIVDNALILFLDDKQEPADKNVVEITKREFNELLNPIKQRR